MGLEEQMVSYAHYHRDPRNIATHLLGIPMIMLAISVLLSLPTLVFGGWSVTPIWVLTVCVVVLYYARLGWRVGLFMAGVLAVFNLVGESLAQDTSIGLRWGVGLFVVGWALQFLGHRWEGRKPAFVDDLRGLLQGPLFVAFELGFRLGWFKPLELHIEQQTGPVRRDPHATPASNAS